MPFFDDTIVELANRRLRLELQLPNRPMSSIYPIGKIYYFGRRSHLRASDKISQRRIGRGEKGEGVFHGLDGILGQLVQHADGPKQRLGRLDLPRKLDIL